jgi:hypothetical protein
LSGVEALRRPTIGKGHASSGFLFLLCYINYLNKLINSCDPGGLASEVAIHETAA